MRRLALAGLLLGCPVEEGPDPDDATDTDYDCAALGGEGCECANSECLYDLVCEDDICVDPTGGSTSD